VLAADAAAAAAAAPASGMQGGARARRHADHEKLSGVVAFLGGDSCYAVGVVRGRQQPPPPPPSPLRAASHGRSSAAVVPSSSAAASAAAASAKDGGGLPPLLPGNLSPWGVQQLVAALAASVGASAASVREQLPQVCYVRACPVAARPVSEQEKELCGGCYTLRREEEEEEEEEEEAEEEEVDAWGAQGDDPQKLSSDQGLSGGGGGGSSGGGGGGGSSFRVELAESRFMLTETLLHGRPPLPGPAAAAAAARQGHRRQHGGAAGLFGALGQLGASLEESSQRGVTDLRAGGLAALVVRISLSWPLSCVYVCVRSAAGAVQRGTAERGSAIAAPASAPLRARVLRVHACASVCLRAHITRAGAWSWLARALPCWGCRRG
jgi:hypothetical protein